MMTHPVENIIYPHGRKLPDGDYEIKVHNFNDRQVTNAFTVEVEINGQIFTYEHTKRIREKAYVVVGKFTVKDGVITYSGQASSRPQSKQVWGLPTNTFHKVLAVFPSPNYWDGNTIGNKHIFFQVEGAENPTKPVGFFNEQIKSELTQHHKRMFEAVASKQEVEKKGGEVSGLGFSTTSPASFFCKIDNKQIIKVTI